MNELSFQEIIDTINKVLAENNLKPALSISIECQYRKTDAINDYFSVAIYQSEKTSSGSTIFHYFHTESIALLKFKLKESINEKNK